MIPCGGHSRESRGERFTVNRMAICQWMCEWWQCQQLQDIEDDVHKMSVALSVSVKKKTGSQPRHTVWLTTRFSPLPYLWPSLAFSSFFHLPSYLLHLLLCPRCWPKVASPNVAAPSSWPNVAWNAMSLHTSHHCIVLKKTGSQPGHAVRFIPPWPNVSFPPPPFPVLSLIIIYNSPLSDFIFFTASAAILLLASLLIFLSHSPPSLPFFIHSLFLNLWLAFIAPPLLVFRVSLGMLPSRRALRCFRRCAAPGFALLPPPGWASPWQFFALSTLS